MMTSVARGDSEVWLMTDDERYSSLREPDHFPSTHGDIKTASWSARLCAFGSLLRNPAKALTRLVSIILQLTIPLAFEMLPLRSIIVV